MEPLDPAPLCFPVFLTGGYVTTDCILLFSYSGITLLFTDLVYWFVCVCMWMFCSCCIKSVLTRVKPLTCVLLTQQIYKVIRSNLSHGYLGRSPDPCARYHDTHSKHNTRMDPSHVFRRARYNVITNYPVGKNQPSRWLSK